MKAILLVLLFWGPLAGAKQLTVLTTFTVIQDMAQAIAGDHLQVVSLTKPGAEIHNYEPTPRDLMAAQRADLILWNGLGLESWFERFFSHLRQVPAVSLSEGVVPIAIKSGAYAGKPNPHGWVSPENGKIYVANIVKAFSKLDPAHRADYEARGAAYRQQLDEISRQMRTALAHIPRERRWLVSSEGAFSYLARDLDFQEAYLWPVNADEQASPRQMRELIDRVREQAIPVVFSESTISDKPMKQVAKETGARYGGQLYVDSLSEADGPVPSYLALLKTDLELIRRGFTAEK